MTIFLIKNVVSVSSSDVDEEQGNEIGSQEITHVKHQDAFNASNASLRKE